jgi:cysteine-rich repeat protein
MKARGLTVVTVGALVVSIAAAPSSAVEVTTFSKPLSAAGGFGAAIAEVAGSVAVGAPDDDSTGVTAGAVYLFNANTGSLVGSILGPPPRTSGDAFGAALARSGANVIIGAPGVDAGSIAGAGSAHLVHLGSGSILATFANPTPGDAFGNSFADSFGAAVAGDGTRVVIGAHHAFGGAIGSGEVYVFDGDTGSTSFGDLLVTIPSTAPGIAPGFGTAVGLVAGKVVVGAPNANVGSFLEPEIIGEAYLFNAQTGALIATLYNPYVPSEDPNIEPSSYDSTLFGVSVAGAGNLILVGSPGNGTTGGGGRAYVFDQSGALVNTLQEPSPAGGGFGVSVAALGVDCLVGATGNDVAYVFDCTSGALLHTLADPNPAFADFGRSVAALGTSVALVTAVDAGYRFAGLDPGCGDTVLDPGEECDDGNTESCDGCSALCTTEGCGNGVVECSEACDDGNANELDCCLSDCTSPCACGNNILDFDEDCDDGNTQGCDGCSPSCEFEFCGNGILDCMEGCDDANSNNDDCCFNNCADPCEDGNSCTEDTCDFDGEERTCDNDPLPAGTICSEDGNECTLDDCSSQGVCRHREAPMNGAACSDDGSDCTTDVCQGGDCTHPSLADSTPCADDGNLCSEDFCVAGVCTHPAVVCDDGDGCTADSCDGGTGQCTTQPEEDGTPCQADLCLEAGMCLAGACDQSVPVVCPFDADPCTTDQCNPQTGCFYTQKNPGAACDPDSGGDDGNACTDGICNAAGQCLHLCASGRSCNTCGSVCGGNPCNCGG